MPPLKEYPFSHILGWSATRYETFSICKRRYFYQYYAKYDPDLPRARIDEFRELVSIPLQIGSVVHHVIETLFNRLKVSQEQIDRDRLLSYAARATERSLRSHTFDEIVYRQMDEITVDDLFPKVELCLINLLESDRFGWLVNQATRSIDHWIIDPPGYGEARLEGMKVYFKVDFLIPLDGELHILDWKTGQPDPAKHRKQLMGYAAWASSQFDVSAEQVRPVIAYLQPEYEEVQEIFTSRDLRNFAVQIRAETQEMYQLCRDPDMNVPLDKREFPLIDNQRICSYCNFRGLCYPEQYPAEL